MADEQTWIKGAEVQGVMDRATRHLLTPALGTLRNYPTMCRKEQVVARGRGASPDWELTVNTVQLLLDRGNMGKGGITLPDTEAAKAFMDKYGLVNRTLTKAPRNADYA